MFDTDRGLIRFDSIQEVSLDDAEDLSSLDERLDELATLEWGGSTAKVDRLTVSYCAKPVKSWRISSTSIPDRGSSRH